MKTEQDKAVEKLDAKDVEIERLKESQLELICIVLNEYPKSDDRYQIALRLALDHFPDQDWSDYECT